MRFVLLVAGGLLVLSAVKHARSIGAATASSDPASSRPRHSDDGHFGIAVGEPNPSTPTKSPFVSGSCDCSSFWAGGTSSCSCSGGK